MARPMPDAAPVTMATFSTDVAPTVSPFDSDRWFENGVDGGGPAVRHSGLAPDLDRERHGHERAEQPEQVLVLIGDALHLDAAEVVGTGLQSREGGVVEGLQLVHRAGDALGVAAALA